jgi:rubrerythrin
MTFNSVSDKPWTCRNCGRIYQVKKSLQRHLRHECGKEPQFKCPICDKAFYHNFIMFTHALQVHQAKLVV